MIALYVLPPLLMLLAIVMRLERACDGALSRGHRWSSLRWVCVDCGISKCEFYSRNPSSIDWPIEKYRGEEDVAIDFTADPHVDVFWRRRAQNRREFDVQRADDWGSPYS